eukprot:gene10350-2764_t
MLKLFVITLTVILYFVISTPVDCSSTAQLLSADPCKDGRVCEYKCPQCDKTIYFDVEPLINHGHQNIWEKICVNAAYNSKGGSSKAGGTISTKSRKGGQISYTSVSDPSNKFFLDILKVALNKLSIRYYTENYADLLASLIRSQQKTAKYLGLYVSSLKGFAKLCSKKKDFEKKFYQQISEHSKKFEESMKTMIESESNWKKDQLKYIINDLNKKYYEHYFGASSSGNSRYCSCSSLIGVSTKVRGKTGAIRITRPLSQYQSNLNSRCQQVCSRGYDVLEIEYLE